MPKPDKQFLKDAQLLKELIETNQNVALRNEHGQLKNGLRKKFMEAFSLLPDRMRTAYKLHTRFENTKFAPKERIFDHIDYFHRGRNLVISSQPYGLDKSELKRWAAECGASYTIATEWGYYYPGHASLFFAEFSPSAKASFDKRLRA